MAAKGGHKTIVEYLADQGADIDIKDFDGVNKCDSTTAVRFVLLTNKS